MLEFCVRIRCDACGTAVERIAVPQPLQIPCAANLQSGALPEGWIVEDGHVFCPPHHPRMVQAATIMPAADTLREIIGARR